MDKDKLAAALKAEKRKHRGGREEDEEEEWQRDKRRRRGGEAATTEVTEEELEAYRMAKVASSEDPVRCFINCYVSILTLVLIQRWPIMWTKNYNRVLISQPATTILSPYHLYLPHPVSASFFILTKHQALQFLHTRQH